MASMFTRLLELQELDTLVDQLRYRRDHLPQRAALKKLAADSSAIDARQAPVKARRSDLAAQEKRLEDEAASVATKATAEDKRLYSGTVTSPRELQAIQEEIDSLRRRQRELEDRALELMTEIEPLDHELKQAQTQQAGLRSQGDTLGAELAGAEADIDRELAAVLQNRTEMLTDIAPATIESYEKLRRRLGNVAVARLEAGSCRGCHIKLSSVDLDRVLRQPPDALVHCEQCGCILVR